MIVKTNSEIAKMQAAQAIADAAFAELMPTLRSGQTEREVAMKLNALMKQHGSQCRSFPTIVAFGENAVEIHHSPNQTTLKSGDFILLDFGAVVKGYHSDMSRTVVFGQASAEQKRMYQVCLDAHNQSAAAVKPGARCVDVYHVAKDIIDAAGYEGKFTHGLGHGVGRLIHELPSLNRKSTRKLRAGSVITIEPGIYVEGVGGVRIEDMGLVTERGFESFARTTKSLMEIT